MLHRVHRAYDAELVAKDAQVLGRASNGSVIPTEARARFREGLELYKGHKNTEARAKYLQALAISQAPTILLNLAIVEYDLMLYPDALRHAKQYVVNPKSEPARVDKLKREMIPELESKTAHLSVDGQAGQAVFVDGEKVGVAPLADQVHVAPGDHTVACGAVTKSVTVKAGDTVTVTVVVREAAPPASAAPSTAGSAPPVASAVPSAAPSSAPAPRSDAAPPEHHESGAGRWIGPIALGAVGVGGIVVGAVFAGSSNSAHDDQVSIQKANGGHACFDKTSTACSQFNSKGSDVSTDSTIAIVGFVAGGVGLAGALAWTGYNLFAKPKSDNTSQTMFAPWVGPQGGGASIQGSF